VCSFLAYKKGKATRIAFSVLLIYTVLSPLSAVIPDFGGLISGEFTSELEGLDREYIEVAERAFCDGVRAHISAELGISAEGVRVLCCGFDYQKMRAERICVLLSGSAATADAVKIRKIITEGGLGECEVEIEV
jgi:hypothetical protein